MIYHHLAVNGSYLVARPGFFGSPPVRRAMPVPSPALPGQTKEDLAQVYAAKSKLAFRREPGRGVIWL